MIIKRVFSALVGAVLSVPIQSSAQTSSGSVVLSGRVTQAGDTSIAVGGAEVEIVGTALSQGANGDGRFRFVDMLPGKYELRVRRIGYEPATLRVVLQNGKSYDQRIELARHPHALTEVRINGQMLKVPARFEDVYARAAHEHGTFFTRHDIDSLNPLDVGSLLDRVPSVYMHGDSPEFARCKGPLSGASPGKSAVQVYIDGTRVTASKSTPVPEALQLVKPKDIEAMEVYTGVARIPAEFLNDACAVIAIWTRSY